MKSARPSRLRRCWRGRQHWRSQIFFRFCFQVRKCSNIQEKSKATDGCIIKHRGRVAGSVCLLKRSGSSFKIPWRIFRPTEDDCHTQRQSRSWSINTQPHSIPQTHQACSPSFYLWAGWRRNYTRKLHPNDRDAGTQRKKRNNTRLILSHNFHISIFSYQNDSNSYQYDTKSYQLQMLIWIRIIMIWILSKLIRFHIKRNIEKSSKN